MPQISRRALIGGAAGATVSWAAGATGAAAHQHSAGPVLYSAGTNRPRAHLPHGAVDAHMHIFEPERFPYPNPTDTPPPRASVRDYRKLQRRLGTSRTVVVTPSNYATDNRCTLDAIARLGHRNARGVAVIDDTFTDNQIAELHNHGIRGIRFNLTRSGGAGVELIRPLAQRVSDLGWNVQVHMTAEGILENLPVLTDLPTELVFDHMGRIPGTEGTSHPAYAAILDLIDAGHTWVKLSGVYLESIDGPPGYADRAAVAAAFVRAAPERMLWGSDWPHTTALRGEVPLPNDADLVDLLTEWAGNRKTLKRILVDNPTRLYDFTSRRGPHH
jgi:predicted TIM-barrel fold metal-dependent hydrolase